MKSISRRSFLDKTAKASAAAIVTSQLPLKGLSKNPAENERMIGIQIGAASFYDEGVSQLLDNVTGMAGVNTIFAYNRGLAGRQMPGEPFPDHGVQKEDTNFVGGYYAKMHEEYYKNTVYKPEFARAPELGDYDVLAEVIPEAKRRNNNHLLVYWLPWHGQEYLPKLASVDLAVPFEYSDPVLVDLLNGTIYQLEAEAGNNTSAFKNLPLADYPMLIVEKEELKYN